MQEFYDWVLSGFCAVLGFLLNAVWQAVKDLQQASATDYDTEWVDQSGGSSSLTVNTQTFTSSGTWTKPSGANFVRVIAIGGGGGGASVDSVGNSGAGGNGADGICVVISW